MPEVQPTSETEQTKHLTEYLFLLVKRKWLILATCALTVGIAVLYNLTLIPVYRATTTIIVDDERRGNPVSGDMTSWESLYSGALKFNTHFSLMTSNPVLERVVSKLELDKKVIENNPRTSLFAGLKKNIELLLGVEEKPEAVIDKLPVLVSLLKDQVVVEPVKDTAAAENHGDGYRPQDRQEYCRRAGRGLHRIQHRQPPQGVAQHAHLDDGPVV